MGTNSFRLGSYIGILAIMMMAAVCVYTPSLREKIALRVLEFQWLSGAFRVSTSGNTGSTPLDSYQTLKEFYVDKEVYRINQEVILILNWLTERPFMRYYKLNLNRDCKLFSESGFCMSRSCVIDPCRKEDFMRVCKKREDSSKVDQSVNYSTFIEWTVDDPSWTVDVEIPIGDSRDLTYVDLVINPEQDTGYSGPSSTRIWRAIYDQNCFFSQNQNRSRQHYAKEGEELLCEEKSFYYRLISGLHASISTHIAQNCLVEGQVNEWHMNSQLFYERVGKYPQRMYNLYVIYLMTLNAFFDMSDYLKRYDYDTTEPDEAVEIRNVMHELRAVVSPLARRFDVRKMFCGENKHELAKQLRHRFRNISVILDCISCERCKLWGKLQVHGLGVALKILLDKKVNCDNLDLTRTEIVAFVNLFKRVSESVHWSEMLMADYESKHAIDLEKNRAEKNVTFSHAKFTIRSSNESATEFVIKPKVGVVVLD